MLFSDLIIRQQYIEGQILAMITLLKIRMLDSVTELSDLPPFLILFLFLLDPFNLSDNIGRGSELASSSGSPSNNNVVISLVPIENLCPNNSFASKFTNCVHQICFLVIKWHLYAFQASTRVIPSKMQNIQM